MKKRKQYPIGAVINKYELKYKVVAGTHCKDCVLFNNYEGTCLDFLYNEFGECSAELRDDNTDVVFQHIEQ